MLALISPAKRLDFAASAGAHSYTTPDFLDDADTLVERMRKLSPAALAGMMSISDKLAKLNVCRFRDYRRPSMPSRDVKQAILAFKGDVYLGLDADSLSEEDLAYAQDHLRILSGLYGLLRPLDLVRPYRLEMGSRFANGDSLYDFWGERLTTAINALLAARARPVLVNLASREYFAAVQPGALQGELVTPIFKDYKKGKYRVINFFAKRARGLMASYIIRNRVQAPAGLEAFDAAGYTFSPENSTKGEMVFLRRED